MLLRNPADYRSLLWVTLAAAMVVLQYAWPQTVLYVLPFSCYLGIACGVIAHNHNHCPTFVRRRANHAFGHVLTLFYGYPTLMWIPTHNLNHHRFVNRPGDATITWRYTNGHNLFIALTYFFVSSYFQSGPIQRYIGYARHHNRRLYARIMFQYAVWIGFIFGTLAMALILCPRWQTGLFLWFFAIVTPAVCSLSMIMFFNYIQHVHADAYSEQDHSRNFTGTIEPRLNEGNLIWFFIKQYVLALALPRFSTQQLGPEPIDLAARSPTVSADEEATPEETGLEEWADAEATLEI
jgi:fatty acid desaturase